VVGHTALVGGGNGRRVAVGELGSGVCTSEMVGAGQVLVPAHV
jgi:hypothetical protein